MKDIKLYKRNAKGEPIVWQATDEGDYIVLQYGIVCGTLHKDVIYKTKVQVSEIESRIKAKRKEGYKEITELKDSSLPVEKMTLVEQYHFLNAYLPKYNTNDEGFVLPMLAKTLEDNKPFDKGFRFMGQWKIDGLRCLIGLTKSNYDMFTPYSCTYHSREGVDWTKQMCWMDEIIIPKLDINLIDLMLEEGAYLDGELYLPGYPVNDINSFVKNTTLTEHYLLQYWCYDICIENMTAVNRDTVRFTSIKTKVPKFNTKLDHLNNNNQFVLLPTVHCISSITDSIELRDKYINLGFEGLILRNTTSEYQFGKRNQAMFKYKKIDDGKFMIVDIISEHKRANLPIFVCRNDINSSLFECSINKPQDVQEAILANKQKYIGKYLYVEYRARSGVNEVPFHARGINIIL